MHGEEAPADAASPSPEEQLPSGPVRSPPGSAEPNRTTGQQPGELQPDPTAGPEAAGSDAAEDRRTTWQAGVQLQGAADDTGCGRAIYEAPPDSLLRQRDPGETAAPAE